MVFAEGEAAAGKRDYVPYRGMRVTTEQQEFKVRTLMAKRNFNEENSLMEITVRFSMPIDPRTVNASTVLINGKKSGSNVIFNYGRKGESVRITIINADEDSFTIKFDGVESYKGDGLKETEFENIQNGTELILGRQ